MANLPTYGRNEAAVTAREAQVALADFDNGANLGASNAPGVGICTAVVNPKLSDWTVADQKGVLRTPQKTQHIGGLGIEDGNKGVGYDIQAVNGADINDTVSFIEATIAAAPGEDAGSGVINQSDVTLEVGDRIWGTNAVA